MKLQTPVVLAVLLAPAVAWACPACARASADGAVVYYFATALMLVTPFVWLRRAARAAAPTLCLLAASVAPGCVYEGSAPITEDQTLGGQVIPAQRLDAGRQSYDKYCLPCHGVDGDGRGRSAAALETPPRDFRSATYKFSGALSGMLPHDEDLQALVRRGLKGTAMLPWGLPQQTLADIVDYTKTFSPEGTGWRDPDMERGARIIPGKDPYAQPERRAEAIARGATLYHGYTACHACHPAYQTRKEINVSRAAKKMPPKYVFRPDRHLSVVKESESYTRPVEGGPTCGLEQACKGANMVCRLGRCEAKLRLVPPDFLMNSVRSGASPEQLYRVIAAGVPGTAMPAWGEALVPDDIWALAWYVHSLTQLKDTPAAAALSEELASDTAPMPSSAMLQGALTPAGRVTPAAPDAPEETSP